ncbi:uncharacterized protein LOC128187441 [Crassostrea angulata]|uniref:uncharacterized protein LOC128187441 n=1 Tax=Magallana angulata TaxID=2784310 RepID=UPI0022B1B1FC|nr:uncharacterized protein LOC128187441 [Crassostrea angulata]
MIHTGNEGIHLQVYPDGEHRDYVVPGSCTNGTIDWNYPKEYVIIHFKGEGHVQYSVCLGGNLGGDMFTLYDVTGDTKQAIPKGTWPCVQAQNGHVSIEIHAPEFQTYMGAVDYSVQTS